MHPLIAWFRASIVRQYFLVFVTIAVLVAMVAVPAITITNSMSSSGGAINISGSMRMQSYKLALAVADPFISVDDRRARVLAACREFGQKLVNPELLRTIPRDENERTRLWYKRMEVAYKTRIYPLAMQSIDDEDARRELVRIIPSFVEAVDVFVKAIETQLNHRLHALKWLLVAILLGSMAMTLAMVLMMRRKIFDPILEIEQVAVAVRGGDFTVRVPAGRADEIGHLASAFNFMLKELGRLYGNLEGEVEKKTLDLNRRNAGLQFITRLSQTVRFDAKNNNRNWRVLLTELTELAQLRGCALMAGSRENCFLMGTSEGWRSIEGGARKRYFLNMDDTNAGELIVAFDGPALEGWQNDLLEAVAQSVGRAMDRATRQLDDRRLAVLEERSTIARELHDSIAQSLAFCRIQLHRVKHFLKTDPKSEALQDALAELTEGLNGANRQLREVLSTFRLQMSDGGFEGALMSAVEEFRSRTGLPVELSVRILDFELSPNAQVHVVHILREALSNIEKHAQAGHVTVAMRRNATGDLVLEVLDDGRGIPENAARANHFGLSIMAERAKALSAKLLIAPRRDTRGTRLLLTIPLVNADAS